MFISVSIHFCLWAAIVGMLLANVSFLSFTVAVARAIRAGSVVILALFGRNGAWEEKALVWMHGPQRQTGSQGRRKGDPSLKTCHQI